MDQQHDKSLGLYQMTEDFTLKALNDVCPYSKILYLTANQEVTELWLWPAEAWTKSRTANILKRSDSGRFLEDRGPKLDPRVFYRGQKLDPRVSYREESIIREVWSEGKS
jgi:hypothetical protein